jgi:hypothetical protein
MTRPPEHARCIVCREIVELELRRDFEQMPEWRTEWHYGYPHDPSGACNGSDSHDWLRLTHDEKAALRNVEQ